MLTFEELGDPRTGAWDRESTMERLLLAYTPGREEPRCLGAISLSVPREERDYLERLVWGLHLPRPGFFPL